MVEKVPDITLTCLSQMTTFLEYLEIWAEITHWLTRIFPSWLSQAQVGACSQTGKAGRAEEEI